jgi:hypothetical protein
MNTELFAIAEVMPGKLNALVKIAMKHTRVRDPNEAVRLINSGTYIITKRSPRWSESDLMVCFSVTSNGWTGPEWITWLENRGFQLTDDAKDVLLSPDFKPTKGVVYSIVVYKGKVFTGCDRTANTVFNKAENQKFSKSHPEVACLIRDKFSDEDMEVMGLDWIYTMHEPIKDSRGDFRLLRSGRVGDGNWFDATFTSNDRVLETDCGFALVESQITPQS